MQQLQLLCRVAKESPHGPLPTTSRQINTEKRSANTKSTIKAIHGEERGWFYSAQKQLAACTHTPSPLPFLSLHSHRPTPAVYSVAPQPLTTHPPRATGRRHTHTPKRLRDTGKPRGFLTVSPGITPAGPNRDPSRRRALLSPGPSRGRPRPSRPAPHRRYAAAPRQVPPHNGASRPAPLLPRGRKPPGQPQRAAGRAGHGLPPSGGRGNRAGQPPHRDPLLGLRGAAAARRCRPSVASVRHLGSERRGRRRPPQASAAPGPASPPAPHRGSAAPRRRRPLPAQAPRHRARPGTAPGPGGARQEGARGAP